MSLKLELVLKFYCFENRSIPNDSNGARKLK